MKNYPLIIGLFLLLSMATVLILWFNIFLIIKTISDIRILPITILSLGVTLTIIWFAIESYKYDKELKEIERKINNI